MQRGSPSSTLAFALETPLSFFYQPPGITLEAGTRLKVFINLKSVLMIEIEEIKGIKIKPPKLWKVILIAWVFIEDKVPSIEELLKLLTD